MTVAQYEAKFTELSGFAPQLIASEEENELKLSWIEALSKEQNIYFEAQCLFRGCKQSLYSGK